MQDLDFFWSQFDRRRDQQGWKNLQKIRGIKLPQLQGFFSPKQCMYSQHPASCTPSKLYLPTGCRQRSWGGDRIDALSSLLGRNIEAYRRTATEMGQIRPGENYSRVCMCPTARFITCLKLTDESEIKEKLLWDKHRPVKRRIQNPMLSSVMSKVVVSSKSRLNMGEAAILTL